jgi:hypothetical protein
MRPHHLALALLATACTLVAVTPPIRTVPLESVATTRPGHVAVRTSGGGHFTGWDAAATANGGGSYGLLDGLELQLDGAFGYAGDVDDERRSASPFVGVGHVGVKHAVLPWLAFTVGAGAGAGPWGAFFGTDLGAIVAYENAYAVPFFAARMQVTAPIAPVTETWIERNGETVTEHMLTPGTVMWFQPSIGVRFPIRLGDDPDGPRLSLTFAGAWTAIYAFDQPGRETGHGFGGEGGLSLEL